ncbi:MAG: hypothetical protein H0U06_04525 [Solirubrobacterales bacterium]|nr:hypothetical protein [Solirubrobacterales bacterium]
MALLFAPMSDVERRHLARAGRRLATLDFYPAPVKLGRVRALHAPWLFRIPGCRRFVGYEAGPLIFTRDPLDEVSNDLITHELCHVWQDQHRRMFMWLSYLWQGYRNNRHEIEARAAARRTRAVP